MLLSDLELVSVKLSFSHPHTDLFFLDEGDLRRSLFEHTGGSYPELITRGDIKLFLPPIGRFSQKDVVWAETDRTQVVLRSTALAILQRCQMRVFVWL